MSIEMSESRHVNLQHSGERSLQVESLLYYVSILHNAREVSPSPLKVGKHSSRISPQDKTNQGSIPRKFDGIRWSVQGKKNL